MGIEYGAGIGVFAVFPSKTPVYEPLKTTNCCPNENCSNYEHFVETKHCGNCGSYIGRLKRNIRVDQSIEDFLEEKGYSNFPESNKGFDYFCLESLEFFDLKRENDLFYEIPEDHSKIIALVLKENKKLLEDLEVYYGSKPEITIAMYGSVG